MDLDDEVAWSQCLVQARQDWILYAENEIKEQQLFDELERNLMESQSEASFLSALFPDKFEEEEDSQQTNDKLQFDQLDDQQAQTNDLETNQKQVNDDTDNQHAQTNHQLLSEISMLQDKIKKLELKNMDLASQTKLNKALENDRLDFEQYKEQEMKRLKHQRYEQEKLLKSERLLLEKNKKTCILPTKKERQEIEDLKRRIVDISSQFKQKEQRLLINQDRLKNRLEAMEKRNTELVQEVKVLEQSRALFLKEKLELQELILSLTKEKEIVAKDIKHDCERVGGLVGDNESRTRFVKNRKNEQLDVSINALNELEQELRLSQNVREKVYGDGKRERFYENGVQLTWYRNGTTKELLPDGHYVIRFLNGDYKKVFPNEKTVYWFSQNNTLQTTFADNLIIYEFDNGQVEKSHPSGIYEILFPDKTRKTIYPSGEEESLFPDGTKQRIDSNGQRIVEYEDGTRELYSEGMKKRVLCDGTIKIAYPDGSQETRFSDGTIQLKSVNGEIVTNKIDY